MALQHSRRRILELFEIVNTRVTDFLLGVVILCLITAFNSSGNAAIATFSYGRESARQTVPSTFRYPRHSRHSTTTDSLWKLVRLRIHPTVLLFLAPRLMKIEAHRGGNHPPQAAH